MAMTLIGGMTEDPRAAFAAQLRQMFGNVGAFTQSQRPLIGEGYGPGASQTVHENANLRKLLEQAALLGGSNDATARWVAGQDIGFDPATNRYTVVVQAPESLGRQAQRFGLDFNPDGSLAGLRDVASGNADFSALDKLLMAGALAAIGYAAAPTMFGGAGAAAPAAESAAAAGGAAGGTGLSAGASGLGLQMPGAAGLGAMGGGTGLVAPGGFVLAPQLGAAAAGGAAGAAMVDPSSGGYFGGLDPAAGGQGLQMPSAASVEGMGGGQGLVATQAPTVAQTGVLGAAPITASQATTVASPFKMALDAVKPYASLIGPATSLIGAATAQMPQMPQNAGARIPGVEAPPEARGYQPASAPILDVLGRNRRSNRNPTLLTGPGGVNMDSVRVGGNTLLGM